MKVWKILLFVSLCGDVAWAELSWRNLKNPFYRSYELGSKFAPQCKNFIERNGELGPWGEELMRAFQQVDPEGCVLNLNFGNACPKYRSLNVDEKKRFISWFFASIAMKEASCNPQAQAVGVNDTADGLFQLEYSKAQRKDANRPEGPCKTNQGVNTQDIRFQMECGAAIFVKGYCGGNRKVGRDSYYWQELNRPNGKIITLAQRFPGCI